MNNLKQVIDNGYSLPSFSELPQTERTKQLGSIKYLEHLASLVKVSPDKCPIDIFINDSGKLPVERNKINMIFFAWNEARVKEQFIPTQSVPLDKVFPIEEEIRSGLTRLANEKIMVIENQDSIVRRNARALAQSEQTLFALQSERDALQKMASDGIHIRPMVEKVLADPFWSLDNRRRGLTFLTPPISLSYFNSAQAVNNTANLGRFSVNINFRTGLFARVENYENNRWVDAFIHPHVDGIGEICFGNAKPTARSCAAKIDLVGYMSVIKDVLTTYNDDNPYRHLHEWDPSSSTYSALDSYEEEEEEEEYYQEPDYDGEPDYV